METATDAKVETFVAKRAVNIGYEIRQAGDFIHEYTDPSEITERALARLIRTGYIERRVVSQADLDAFQEAHPRPVEVAEAEDGETSVEEPTEPADEPTEAPGIEVEEESIDDLGPVEDETKEQPKKKVVRTPRRRS